MTEMTFDVPAFNGGSDGLNQTSSTATSDLSSGVTSNLSPPSASSPVGGLIATLTSQLQGGLATVGPSLAQDATSNNSKTHSAMSAIQAQDAANAAKITAGSTQAGGDLGGGQGAGDAAEAAGGAAEEAAGAAEDAAGAAEDLDPASIDQEARDKASQMLGGDQMTQQMGQMLGQAAQAGAQAGQQLSQQFNQVGQQMGQAVQQAGQQLGQLVGQATQSLSAPGVSGPGLDALGATADLGAGGGAGEFGGIPDFGGAGGGAGLGDMGGDGIGDTPGTDAAAPGMTTSAALLPPPLTPPGTGTSASSTTSAARVPAMMPMMPMAGAAAQQGAGTAAKRDPVIFAERPLYESPEGVEQTIGARPEIESEEPPFGDAEAVGR